MQRIYLNGHCNGAYFMVVTPAYIALNCFYHLKWSRETRRTWPTRLGRKKEAFAASVKSVFETTWASAWPKALGRPAVRNRGWVRKTRFLRVQNRCNWVQIEINMIPWDSGRTIIVKSAAFVFIEHTYMQRIYPNGHVMGAYFMVFRPT